MTSLFTASLTFSTDPPATPEEVAAIAAVLETYGASASAAAPAPSRWRLAARREATENGVRSRGEPA